MRDMTDPRAISAIRDHVQAAESDAATQRRRAEGAERSRDEALRMLYRLDAAVTHHEHFTWLPFAGRDEHDEALYAARERIMIKPERPL